MKKRIQLIAFALSLSFFLCGCGNAVKIKSVAFPETVTLKSSTKNPHSIWIAFKGRIEGEGQNSLMLEGRPYKTKELNGDIDFEWKSDWYSPTAIIKCESGNTKSGNLTIEYDF